MASWRRSLGVLGFAFPDADAGGIAVARVVARAAARAQVGVGVDVIGGLVCFGEDQVFRGAAQDGIGTLLVFGQDEQPGARQAADQDVAHLRRGLAAGEPVHIDALQRQQLVQAGRFDGRRRGLIVGGERGQASRTIPSFHPLPAFRASSS